MRQPVRFLVIVLAVQALLAVTFVVADPSIPVNHPTVRAAGSLGIPVLEPAQASVQFAGWRSRTDALRPAPAIARRPWLFRRSAG